MNLASLISKYVLGRYVGLELVWGAVITLLSLVIIVYFITFASEMGNIGQQDFTTITAVTYVLLKIPKIMLRK